MLLSPQVCNVVACNLIKMNRLQDRMFYAKYSLGCMKNVILIVVDLLSSYATAIQIIKSWQKLHPLSKLQGDVLILKECMEFSYISVSLDWYGQMNLNVYWCFVCETSNWTDGLAAQAKSEMNIFPFTGWMQSFWWKINALPSITTNTFTCR